MGWTPLSARGPPSQAESAGRKKRQYGVGSCRRPDRKSGRGRAGPSQNVRLSDDLQSRMQQRLAHVTAPQATSAIDAVFVGLGQPGDR
jgi:hypothetical protein